MSRLFVGNFAWEESLAGGALPARLLQTEVERACVWSGAAEAGDEILFTAIPDANWLARMRHLGLPEFRVVTPAQLGEVRVTELVPWGWNNEFRDWAAHSFPETRVPDPANQREVNTREFQNEVCRHLGCALDGEGTFRKASDLASHLGRQSESRSESAAGQWVLKANLGFAGRNQRRIPDCNLTAEDLRWIEKRIQLTGAVAVEPWLRDIVQLGGQWEILPTGEIQFIGLTRLLCDSRGGYVGTATSLGGLVVGIQQEVRDQQLRAVEIIAAAGYFGPVGIDAMLHQTNNGPRMRPIQDINARWTMGRLALAWRDRFVKLGIGREGTWIHGSRCETPGAIHLSPATVGGQAVRSGNWWIPENT